MNELTVCVRRILFPPRISHHDRTAPAHTRRAGHESLQKHNVLTLQSSSMAGPNP